MPAVAAVLSYRRLRWLGHVARMDSDRLPKQVLFRTVQGTGGKPLKAWNDYVRDDLSLVRMSYDWWRKVPDRYGSKTTIEQLLRLT